MAYLKVKTMSFLKKENLSIGGESVLLFELSALQRAEYFEYLATLEADIPEGASEMKMGALVVKKNVQSNSWLVSRSLWHSTPDRDEEEMHREVMRTWSSEALNMAVEKVLELSDLMPKPQEEAEFDNTALGDESAEARPLAK
ncbi:phage minor tail protein G [Enterobacter sp. Ap-916]|uniref:phage tail assembly chaperone G n=1 Tax=unclassified Enterobacter TaxID=2608935 RepID=UPI0014240E1D|nr:MULTISPECIES: phage minor tail protein G [unclassified Enterobacter]NIF58968.1 phage minor tail protein G [Enterobacter sp. Ap-867]NIG29616.1 phage minor tail protein G [Enterobacter sp. Ap-916]